MHDKKITRQDFANALKDMDTFMDITVDDLMTINQRANQHARLRLSHEILVDQFMTKPVFTIISGSTITSAAEIMLEKNVAGLPVVDGDKNLIGIFTEADLLTAVGVPRHKPHQSVWSRLETIFSHEPALGNFSGSVNSLMVKEVITIVKENTLGDVLSKMQHYEINRLVVTENTKVIGIVTRSNLLRIILEQLSQKDQEA